MSINASLSGSLKITDNLTGSTSLSKVLANAYTGDISTYGQTVSVGTSTYTVAIPNNLAQFVYIKNLSSTVGNTVTVSWTPTGAGFSVTVLTLDPGALIVFSEVLTSNGITTLTLNASLAATPVEFILCG